MKWSTKIRNRHIRWHIWFAWYPVHISKNEKVWLERVIRRQKREIIYGWLERLFFIPDYEYKESVLDILKDEDGQS